MKPSGHSARMAAGCVCALFALSGCVPQTGTSDDDTSSLPELVLSASAPRPPAAAEVSESEPNDDYDTATPVTVDGSATLAGSISPGSNPFDRDFYNLGSAAAGDRIRAQISINAGTDIVLGVLDDKGREIGYLDVSTLSAGPSQMDIVVREPTSHLFVVLATRSSSSQARSYDVRITIDRAWGVPAYRPQVIVLSFQGAENVTIGNRPAVDVPPFDAANIDSRFAGQTAAIIQNIHQMMTEAYEGLGVAFYLSTDPYIPEGPRSTVYFGTYDSRLLGLADNIDPYNADLQQDAILYTDTFSVFSALSPDVAAISQALANTAAHEVGHLVGLRHTADPHDLMDTTATARQMMVRQWFRASSLNASVMPIGFQDSPSMLNWTVGGVLAPPRSGKTIAARQKTIDLASKGIDFHIPRAHLMSGCDGVAPEASLPQ